MAATLAIEIDVDREGRAKIRAAEAEVEASFNRIKQHAGGLSSTVKRLGAAVAAAFAVKQIADFGAHVVRLSTVQERAGRKIQALVRATGAAAGFSAKQIQAMAGELQEAIGVGDEAIMETQGVMLSFRNVTGEVFRESIELSYDLAEVLGTDASSAALQLGKALNAPVRGASALSRAGVQFTEQQKEQIKTLQESGDLLGAQGVILEELRNQVGGVSRALAAGTFEGAMTRAGNLWGDLLEKIGDYVTRSPAVIEAVRGMGDMFATWGERVKGFGTLSADVMGGVLTVVKVVGQGFLGLRHVWNLVQIGFDGLVLGILGAVDTVVAGVEKLLGALNFRGVFDEELVAVAGFRQEVEGLTDAVGAHIDDQVADIRNAQAAWEGLGRQIDNVKARVRAAGGNKVALGGMAGERPSGPATAGRRPAAPAARQPEVPAPPSFAGEFAGADEWMQQVAFLNAAALEATRRRLREQLAAETETQRAARALDDSRAAAHEEYVDGWVVKEQEKYEVQARGLEALIQAESGGYEQRFEAASSFYDALDARMQMWAEAHELTVQRVAEVTVGLMDTAIQGFSSAVAQAIVYGKSFAKTLEQVYRQIAAQMIQTVVQLTVQWLVQSLIRQKAAAAEFVTQSARNVSLAATQAGATYAALGTFGGLAGVAHGGLDYVPREATYLLDKGEGVVRRNENERLSRLLDAFERGELGGTPHTIVIENRLSGRDLGRTIVEMARDGEARSGRFALALVEV